VLRRNRSGHYVTSGEINGQPVVLMLDTGASDVAVPENMAARLRLEKMAPLRVSTANGYADAWLTRIREMRIGNIVLRDVRASINPGMNHDESILLGMSALKNIEFSQKDDTMTLRR
jgi:aspartyl protease family protein